MVNKLSNRFKPSVLNPESIQLTTSPLDDYQRLFFATVLSKFYPENPTSNGSAKKADVALMLTRELRLRSNIYRSAILKKLSHSSYSAGSYNGIENTSNNTVDGASIKQKGTSKKAKNTKECIDCFQMKLPDLVWPVSISNCDAQPETPLRINPETVRLLPDHHLKDLCLDTEMQRGSMMSANIVLQCDRASDAPREDDDPEDMSLLEGPGICTGANSTTTLAPPVADMRGNSFSSLNMNQEYRANNEEHRKHANTQLINKNNLIIWSSESGYVFLTGIWKMYQDVMRGLILGRRGPGNNTCTQTAQELCRYEFEFAVSEAFYRCIEKELDLNGERATKKARRSRASGIRTPACLSAMGISVGPNEDDTACVCSPLLTSQYNSSSGDRSGGDTFRTGDATKISYNDIHWTKISSELNSILIQEFKQSIMEEYGVGTEIGGIEIEALSSLIERIKGGSIRIQGTWAPMRIARSMCLRFCFPIRYMLVPVFGEGFPSDCRAWFERFAQLKNERLSQKRRETAESLANQPVQVRKGRTFNNPLSNDRILNTAVPSNGIPRAVSGSPVVASAVSSSSPLVSPLSNNGVSVSDNSPLISPLSTDTRSLSVTSLLATPTSYCKPSPSRNLPNTVRSIPRPAVTKSKKNCITFSVRRSVPPPIMGPVRFADLEKIFPHFRNNSDETPSDRFGRFM